MSGSRSNTDDRGAGGGGGRYESEGARNGRNGNLPPGADSARKVEFKRSVSAGSASNGADDESVRGERYVVFSTLLLQNYIVGIIAASCELNCELFIYFKFYI